MRLGQRDDPKGSCSPSILSLQRSIPVHLTYDLIYMCVCVCVCAGYMLEWTFNCHWYLSNHFEVVQQICKLLSGLSEAININSTLKKRHVGHPSFSLTHFTLRGKCMTCWDKMTWCTPPAMCVYFGMPPWLDVRPWFPEETEEEAERSGVRAGLHSVTFIIHDGLPLCVASEQHFSDITAKHHKPSCLTPHTLPT